MAVLGATNLTGCNSIPDFILGGSLVTFQQTSAPTSWTKQTSHDNKALRVVSGTAGSGGSTAFTSVFASRSISSTTLNTAQLAIHSHVVSGVWITTGGSSPTVQPGATLNPSSPTSETSGSGNSHNHDALDFAVQYVDLIICSKN